MQALRAIRDWVVPVPVPVDFLRLSQDCVEEIDDRVRNSNTLLNKSQCGELSSKLLETIENVRALILNCGESSTPFTTAICNLYKISEKAKRLVSNCSSENWHEASLILQLQNDESFQEILLEMGLCYNVICEQAKGMRGEGDPQIKDLRESSTFSPASKEKVREDQESLREVLVRLAGSKCSSNPSEKCLAEYLLRRIHCRPQHGQANELGISTSALLWVKETEPPGTWRYDGFLGGGSGASGVCKTQWLGIPCAKKEFHKEVEKAIFDREAGILCHLSHPNIVNFFCCSNGPEKGQCFIGMELMQMSLSDLIECETKKGRKSFPLSTALDIIVQIARGMCYLHDFGIAHRDLKPSNVVVNRLDTPHLDDNFCVKLVDFGMSKTKVEVSKSNTISIPGVGTTRYRAPEVHPKAQNPTQGDKGHAKAFWFKADAYSFGVTCAEILSLKTPFADVQVSDMYTELVRGARPELPSHCPGKLMSLLTQCWSGDPRSRPRFIDICTRLEAVRHDVSRGSMSVAHRGLQEVGIDPISYKYIEEMLRKYEHQRQKHSAEQPDNLHIAGLDELCDVVSEEAKEDEGRGSRVEEIWEYEHDDHRSGTGIFTSEAQFRTSPHHHRISACVPPAESENSAQGFAKSRIGKCLAPTGSAAQDKLKASNFPANTLKIGSWERVSRYKGDLVAKFYYAKRKLVWEILDSGLKSKIEIQWSDILAIKATCPQNLPGSLEIEVSRPPLFFKETNPQARKHTLWQATTDFTGGQASIRKCHYLQFSKGVLNKHYEKLMQCDPRLKALVDATLSGSNPHYDSSDSAFEGQSVLRPKSRSPLIAVFEGYNDQPHSPWSPYSPSQGRMSSSEEILEIEREIRSIDMHRNETFSPSSVMEICGCEEGGDSGNGGYYVRDELNTSSPFPEEILEIEQEIRSIDMHRNETFSPSSVMEIRGCEEGGDSGNGGYYVRDKLNTSSPFPVDFVYSIVHSGEGGVSAANLKISRSDEIALLDEIDRMVSMQNAIARDFQTSPQNQSPFDDFLLSPF